MAFLRAASVTPASSCHIAVVWPEIMKVEILNACSLARGSEGPVKFIEPPNTKSLCPI